MGKNLGATGLSAKAKVKKKKEIFVTSVFDVETMQHDCINQTELCGVGEKTK